MPVMLAHLRNHAIARSLFAPPTLSKAMERLGFVQADALHAPARAQDLMLRHRVKDYAAGDLDTEFDRMLRSPRLASGPPATAPGCP